METNNILDGSKRNESFSAASDDSQTAAQFIDSQLRLEADAREALPYAFDSCTQPLGPLRQILYACLSCNPPKTTSSDSYTPAAVCYSCSISCHGEHTLVELFNKRDFVCDCGTTRFPADSPCSLRINSKTNTKGDVKSEIPAAGNRYNHNFQNYFCGCGCDYDVYKEKGTMFQCLGLGTTEDGGCGEDWWHPACVVGLEPSLSEKQVSRSTTLELETTYSSTLATESTRESDEATDAKSSDLKGKTKSAAITTKTSHSDDEEEDDDPQLPPGFPEEDDFEGFICYKCVDANPWIKRYAGTTGFLPPVYKRSLAPSPESGVQDCSNQTSGSLNSLKRKADTEEPKSSPKRVKDDFTLTNPANAKSENTPRNNTTTNPPDCRYSSLPTPPPETMSLFFKADFRLHICRCSSCFQHLKSHPQLLEEEESYQPPMSESGEDAGGSTAGSGSLLDRGERALTNMDRVRAIEGVMAYNHLKNKLTPFFKEFAESGKAISADDIKSHFAKLRGDEEAIKKAGEAAANDGSSRKEQRGN